MRTAMTPLQRLELLLLRGEACDPGFKWALEQGSAEAAWNNCTEPGWLFWALDELGLESRKKARQFLIWAAEFTPSNEPLVKVVLKALQRIVLEESDEDEDLGKYTQIELNTLEDAVETYRDLCEESSSKKIRDINRIYSLVTLRKATAVNSWTTFETTTLNATEKFYPPAKVQCHQIRLLFGDAFREALKKEEEGIDTRRRYEEEQERIGEEKDQELCRYEEEVRREAEESERINPVIAELLEDESADHF